MGLRGPGARPLSKRRYGKLYEQRVCNAGNTRREQRIYRLRMNIVGMSSGIASGLSGGSHKPMRQPAH
jgi:hypothetical protein